MTKSFKVTEELIEAWVAERPEYDFPELMMDDRVETISSWQEDDKYLIFKVWDDTLHIAYVGDTVNVKDDSISIHSAPLSNDELYIRRDRFYVSTIEFLWSLLDDIDTAGDIAKDNDQFYRSIAEGLQKRRWETGIKTNGYHLDLTMMKNMFPVIIWKAQKDSTSSMTYNSSETE